MQVLSDAIRRWGVFVGSGCLGATLLVLSGCASPADAPEEELSEAPAEPNADELASDSPDVAAAAAPAEIEAVAPLAVEVVDASGLQQTLERLRGRVVLVDSWATWCLPCMKQLPHTFQLAKRHEEAGLAVVLLNFDDVDDNAAVGARLGLLAQQHDAAPVALQSDQGYAPEAYEAFAIANEALPNYKLYDRDGKLLHEFVSGDPDRVFSESDLDAAVEQALAAQPAP